MKFLCVIGLILISTTCWAGLFRAESETLNSFRQNDKYKLETPLYEFVSASYTTDKRDFEINSNFSLFTDPTGNANNKAYLYIMDARFFAIPDRLSFRVGRSFDVINSIGAASVDMISTELYLFDKQIRLGGFLGIERKLEAYDLDLKSNVIGAKVDFHSDDPLSLYLSSKFVRRTSANNINENLVQFSGKKAFDWSWNPEFIVDSESELISSNLNRFEVGMDIYPSISTFSKIRFLTYNVLPQTGVEQPIFTIFSTGPLNEVRYQFEKKLSSRFVGSFSIFYDDYQLLANQRTTGSGGELEGKFFSDSGFTINNIIYAFQSYGGNAIGDRVGLQTEYSKKNELYGLLDVVYYEKITSSKRGAFACELGWSRLLGQKFKFTLSGQASTNNILKEDFRTLAKLTYLLWDEL